MQTESAWKRALVQLRLAEEHYRKVTNSAYELAGCRTSAMTCQLFHGELSELSAAVPTMVRDAIRRGDHHTASMLRTRLGIVHLVGDDPEQAKRDVLQAQLDWTAGDDAYLIINYNALLSLCDIALYQDRPEDGVALLLRDRKRIHRSLIDRVALIRANLDFAAGRLAVAHARKARGDAKMVATQCRILASSIRSLGRVDVPMGNAWRLVLEACAAELGADRPRALERLGAALGAFERLDMKLYAEAVRFRLGELERGQLGSEESERLIHRAEGWLRQQGVKQPERLIETMVPRCS
jgi:hypothetical protein